MASEKVRFAGDIVAAVVTESRDVGVDASELVEVEYEPLPVITDVVQAARDEVLLFEDMGTNVCLHVPVAEPDEHLFDGCEVRTSGAIFSPRLAACPIEPRATAAEVGDDGRLTVWLSTQTPHTDKIGPGSAARVRARPGTGGGARSAEDSAARAWPRRMCSRRGWRGRQAGPRAGRRPAARTWWRCITAAPSGSTSSSAATVTAR